MIISLKTESLKWSQPKCDRYIGYALLSSVVIFMIKCLVVYGKNTNTTFFIVEGFYLGIFLLIILLAVPVCFEKSSSLFKKFVCLMTDFWSRDQIAEIVLSAYTITAILAVFLTGGTQYSPLAGFMLINAAFGFGIANGRMGKWILMIVPLCLYMIMTLVFFYDNYGQYTLCVCNPVSLGMNDWIAYILVGIVTGLMTNGVEGRLSGQF